MSKEKELVPIRTATEATYDNLTQPRRAEQTIALPDGMNEQQNCQDSNDPILTPDPTHTAVETETGQFTSNLGGVYYADDDGKKHWICSRLQIAACARDNDSENWGRLLEFPDLDGRLHTWAMPMELLRAAGDDLRGELLRLGLRIAPGRKAREKLLEYITTSKPTSRARCVRMTGWMGDAFVLPERTIGSTSEMVIYQGERSESYYKEAGTLALWKRNVSALCIGNSRLLLCTSCALAAMLIRHANTESGGIHLVGESSSGKTTALRVACSVFGPPNYLQRWRATDNGLEALAGLHNDTLLVLDEMAQVDPNLAGEIAYMLANGTGKQRAGRSGSARARHAWRLLFLSAGEIGLAQHMLQARKRARAGQEVRLVDIPADAGVGLGIFENLHGFDSGAAFSQALTEAAARHYGTAAIEFLQIATQPENLRLLSGMIEALCTRFEAGNLPPAASGQVHRVCRRFALIAAAGEIATKFGITGWDLHSAESAAAACFQAWLDQRGGAGNQERTTILAQVKAFFEAHGDSRFTPWGVDSGKTFNRAGFRDTLQFGPVYYVLPEIFRNEICSGFDSRAVTKILVEARWLDVDSDGKPQCRVSLPGIGRTRCYIFLPAMWTV